MMKSYYRILHRVMFHFFNISFFYLEYILADIIYICYNNKLQLLWSCDDLLSSFDYFVKYFGNFILENLILNSYMTIFTICSACLTLFGNFHHIWPISFLIFQFYPFLLYLPIFLPYLA